MKHIHSEERGQFVSDFTKRKEEKAGEEKYFQSAKFCSHTKKNFLAKFLPRNFTRRSQEEEEEGINSWRHLRSEVERLTAQPKAGTTRATPTATPLVVISDGGGNLAVFFTKGVFFHYYSNNCSGVRTSHH